MKLKRRKMTHWHERTIEMGFPGNIPHYTKGRTTPLFHVGFMEELERAWGGRRWGAQNHAGTLEMVLVHRPGDENTATEFEADPGFFNLPSGNIDLSRMQSEHDAFAQILQDEGTEVIYLEPEPPCVGTYGFPLRAMMYARTGTVINGGAIIDRNANHYKRGMERFYAQRLANLGCPILYTVHGLGCFESSDLIFVRPNCAVLARSVRTNQDGIDQVERLLRANGVDDVIYTDIPGYWKLRENQWGGSSGYFHLDAVLGVAADDIVVVYAGGVGYHLFEELEKRGIDIVEVPDSEVGTLAANLLAIKPGTVVIPAGNPITTQALRRKGIKVYEIDFTEILKAGGGPKCITMPLVHR
jgi:N-dimethylarginine dimethylaminohydrolase